ncbi:MAG: prepilin-type N-terminal cleavage/methylation domain-containing protein [Polyangia bacterium]
MDSQSVSLRWGALGLIARRHNAATGGGTNRQPCGRTQGTTLIELMIVIVILGVLAAIATIGYKRYVARARLSEADAMLAELAAKEQLYFMDMGAYVPARLDDNLTQPSPDEAATAFIPVSPTAPGFESARTPQTIPNPQPSGWSRIGLRPPWNQLYCTYLVNAGPASQGPHAGIGQQLWTTTPSVPWFYALAACNLNTANDGSIPAGLPANATFLAVTHDSPALITINDGN